MTSLLLFSQTSDPIFAHKYLQAASSQASSESTVTVKSEMPTLRFRDYVCQGLGKADDDRVARTSSHYLRLELQQAL